VQFRSIQARIAELDQQAATAAASGSSWKKASQMGIGPLVVLLLTKGKFLLLGVPKIGTLLTKLASLGLYWTIYGWDSRQDS